MRPLSLPLCLLVAGILTLPRDGVAGDVILRKAPPLTVREAPDYPQNLARYHLGADLKAEPRSVPVSQLQLSSKNQDKNTAEAALLCDDPTIGYELPAGHTNLLISLSKIENIESVSFLNEGAQGHFAVAISSADMPVNSPAWHEAAMTAIEPGTIAIRIGPGDAKYVRLSFDVTKPGRIAALGLYATPALSDFTMPRPTRFGFENESAVYALINFSYGDLHVRARGLYASSGDLAEINSMLDDQPATAYRFAAGDQTPTAVIDLGQERSLTRLSAVYAQQPGTVSFYVLRNLPLESSDDRFTNESKIQQTAHISQTADLPPSLNLTDAVMAELKPVGSVTGADEGRAAVDFPEVTGRYVMLRWHPAAIAGEPFSIAQVAAFGRLIPSETARRESKEAKEGKGGKRVIDYKDIPAEGPKELEVPPPEEGPPPALPPVPPFTFIPEVPPTSP
jgi:hypothetical protein